MGTQKSTYSLNLTDINSLWWVKPLANEKLYHKYEFKAIFTNGEYRVFWPTIVVEIKVGCLPCFWLKFFSKVSNLEKKSFKIASPTELIIKWSTFDLLDVVWSHYFTFWLSGELVATGRTMTTKCVTAVAAAAASGLTGLTPKYPPMNTMILLKQVKNNSRNMCRLMDMNSLWQMIKPSPNSKKNKTTV